MLECPSRSCRVLRSAPASWARDAAPWRRSCSRTGGSPARSVEFAESGGGVVRVDRLAVLAGEHVPGVGPQSGRAVPACRGWSSWRRRCARRTATVCLSRATARRPAAVLGSPSTTGVAGGGALAFDGQHAAVEVDGGPPQAAEFAAAQAAQGGEPPEREQRVLGGVRRGRCELLRRSRPRPTVFAGAFPVPRRGRRSRPGRGGAVAGHPMCRAGLLSISPSPDRGLSAAAQRGAQVVQRRGRLWPALAVGRPGDPANVAVTRRVRRGRPAGSGRGGDETVFDVAGVVSRVVGRILVRVPSQCRSHRSTVQPSPVRQPRSPGQPLSRARRAAACVRSHPSDPLPTGRTGSSRSSGSTKLPCPRSASGDTTVLISRLLSRLRHPHRLKITPDVHAMTLPFLWSHLFHRCRPSYRYGPLDRHSPRAISGGPHTAGAGWSPVGRP